mmetsp:Transcript_1165/g.3732  ORF Transcript_1165/g.3732 Transcript_1165/m.3732 type:complete len:221 (-) Transcript_1165:210-872(-)
MTLCSTEQIIDVTQIQRPALAGPRLGEVQLARKHHRRFIFPHARIHRAYDTAYVLKVDELVGINVLNAREKGMLQSKPPQPDRAIPAANRPTGLNILRLRVRYATPLAHSTAQLCPVCVPRRAPGRGQIRDQLRALRYQVGWNGQIHHRRQLRLNLDDTSKVGCFLRQTQTPESAEAQRVSERASLRAGHIAELRVVDQLDSHRVCIKRVLRLFLEHQRR